MGKPQSFMGIWYDPTDQRQKEMLQIDGRQEHLQYPILKGPKGFPWQVDNSYSTSSKMLTDTHKEIAFEAAIEKKNLDYARYLGIHLPKSWHKSRKFQKIFSRKLKIAGTVGSSIVAIHRKFLLWLGDLHVQIIRCLENEVILSDFTHDLRTVDPSELEEHLDIKNIPVTNELNYYRYLGWYEFPEAHSIIVKRWLSQDDSQINNYHRVLEIY